MPTLHKALVLSFVIAFVVSAADPPPDVDAALRSRVQEFYQLQVDKKFRQAEQLVAEDAKDFYYNSQKPDLRVFTIGEIHYGPDFNTARVTISVRKQFLIPGAPPIEMNVVGASTDWKIEDGKWCWYVDRTKPRETPFGLVSPQPSDAAGSPPPRTVDPVSAIAMMNGVHAEPNRLHLDPDDPKPQIVTLNNTLPGPVTIESMTNSPALKVAIAKPNLGARESTEVTITPVAGSAGRPAELVLRVNPIGQTLRIALDYGQRK